MQDPKDKRKDQDNWPTRDRDWDSDKRRSNDDGRKIQESTDYFKPPRPKDDD